MESATLLAPEKPGNLINPESLEAPSWLKKINVNKVKQVVGRIGLTLSLGFGSSLALEVGGPIAGVTHESVAYASDGGYPHADAPCYPYSIDQITGICKDYDWRIPTKDSSGRITGWPYWTERGYGARNCTDFVAWKLQTLGVSDTKTRGLGHGGQWHTFASKNGLSTGEEPRVGAAAVKPATYKADGSIETYGHVSLIKSIQRNSDGTIASITIEEYNQRLDGTFGSRTGKPSELGFSQYVYFDGLMDSTKLATYSSGSSETASAYRDGMFLKVNESGAIYRMVGGAPVRIYNQGALPDFKGQVTSISHDQLGKLPSYPNDEGDIINLVEAGNAKYRFVGGAPVRIFNCAALPGNCEGAINVNFESLVQSDHMRTRPKDGSVINIAEAGGSGIYEFVGGAPIRQFNWGAIPNFGPAISVNHQSLAQLDHMNPVPEDGSVVSIVEAGGSGLYRFVGGAPVRLFNWGAIPDCCGTVVNINEHSLATLDHMNARPADGALINIQEAGGSGIYRFAGGAPLRLFNWGIIPGMKPAVNVNSQSLGSLDHMNAHPENGEFIASIETGIVYRVVGGAALRLYNHGAIPGYGGATFVNQETLNTLDHLKAQPADGTVLQGVTSGSYWKIVNGKRTQVAAQNGAVIVDEQTISNFPAG